MPRPVRCSIVRRSSIPGLALLALASLALSSEQGEAQEKGPRLSLPVDCALGSECFVQQAPDMDGGPGVADPFCGTAAYDGHTGTDFRVRSLADMARGVDVIAAAPGTVLRARDGEPDRMLRNDDPASVEGRECGNGVLIDHGAFQTLSCHLRAGSVRVRPGDEVARGEPIGEIGASGLAQFPHVEFGVLRGEDEHLDPFTGRTVGGGCAGEGERVEPLWDEATAEKVGRPGTRLLDVGLADGPVSADALAEFGPPARPDGSGAAVVYGWAINLRDGDRMRLVLENAAGDTIATHEAAIEGRKAQWVAFAGSRDPGKGPFRGRVEVLREGEVVASGAAE